MLASGSEDAVAKLWYADIGQLVHTLQGHTASLYSLAWLSYQHEPLLVTSSEDKTIRLWDITTGTSTRIIEGHTGSAKCVAITSDQQIIASKGGSKDNTIRLWCSGTGSQVAVIPELSRGFWPPGLAFHPRLPLLAAVGSDPDAPEDERDTLIHIWELDLAVLLGKTPQARATPAAVHHTTAKIVLVGDSGVGKTGLSWRLAHGEFKEHASTHGQQFWVLNALSTRRADGTECEAILWDLAGQPDYRLTHALLLDDADLALVLFDPTDSRDPLHGVEFWLKQLKVGQTFRTSGQQTQSGDKQAACPTILIGARADRGEARLTQEELDAFCRQRGISGGYLATSARENIGVEELLRRMKDQIPWYQKTTTVTTVTFKRVKDYALALKENRRRRKVIVSPQDLRRQLGKTDKTGKFTDAEMMTAVGHLANYGYMRVLRTSKGEERILLVPELLNNLAASFVLEARRNPRGLGALEEKRLLAGAYPFRELEKLTPEERDVLLDAAALLFLEHNICFRETDPLGGKSYLVFPELINLKKPVLEDEQPTEDGVAYMVSGAVENVYASLVVLLGYTQTFTRTDQWRSQARYAVGDGLICGFRQDGRDRSAARTTLGGEFPTLALSIREVGS
jgi:GTPase SAR1 family protein